MSSNNERDIESSETRNLITRREAVQRVTAMLGGIALVGGSTLLTACEREGERDRAAANAAAGGKVGDFSPEDIAFLDEVADTILPDTAKSPGAKAAKTGAFMALMVTDAYDRREQRVFRDGMKTLDDASKKMHKAAFMKATPQQRLALLQQVDREAKQHTEAQQARRGSPAQKEEEAKQADKPLPDQRQENAPTAEAGAGGATAVTEAPAPHYFRMMKELAMLGYFTSEIGYTKAMRYVETPGRYDPCAPYTPGEPAWAPHA